MTETTVVSIDLGERGYDISIGSGLLQQRDLIASSLAGRQVLVVSDKNVAAAHLPTLRASLSDVAVECVILDAGEASKSVESWQRLLDTLVAMGAQRDVTLIALGGGVVGDLTGFVAASYMRGAGFVQIPTSLLSQVDASVGGKTAINHPSGKNLIGAFYQPQAVFIDLDTLSTLPDREYLAGLAEVVKIALIRDREFFDQLDEDLPRLLLREPAVLARAIEICVRHKAEVVALDERETGHRALLNLGHTFGHAVETLSGYGGILHGEAVAIGMAIAARLSAQLGGISATEADHITHWLQRAGLPTALPATLAVDDMVQTMRLDKKNRAGRIRLVLLDGLGSAYLTDAVDERTIAQVLSSHPRG